MTVRGKQKLFWIANFTLFNLKINVIFTKNCLCKRCGKEKYKTHGSAYQNYLKINETIFC